MGLGFRDRSWLGLGFRVRVMQDRIRDGVRVRVRR